MPSGSHGGSSGSHSSGGSSGGGWGGSHFGGSGGGSYRPPRPMHVRWGHRRYYISAGKASTIRTLFSIAAVLVFFAIILGYAMYSNDRKVEKIKEDQIYYINMIDYALEHEEYQKEGTITGRFYNEDCRKWYITYSLPTAAGGTLKGYTFSVYTSNDIKKEEFQVGEDILLAVDSLPVNLFTDSINMAYKDIPLEADGEYIQTLNSTKALIVMECVVICAVVVLIIVAVTKMKKNAQDEEKLGKITESTSVLSNQNSTTNLQSSVKYCDYCGTPLGSNEKKCSGCGAVNRKR